MDSEKPHSDPSDIIVKIAKEPLPGNVPMLSGRMNSLGLNFGFSKVTLCANFVNSPVIAEIKFNGLKIIGFLSSLLKRQIFQTVSMGCLMAPISIKRGALLS